MRAIDEIILRRRAPTDDDFGSFAESQPITKVETQPLPPLSDFAAWAELRGFEVA